MHVVALQNDSLTASLAPERRGSEFVGTEGWRLRQLLSGEAQRLSPHQRSKRHPGQRQSQ